MARHIEDTLALGSIFRVNSSPPEGPDDPNDPGLAGTDMELLRAGIRARRELSPYMDMGRFMDTVGLQSEGCEMARWFAAEEGILIVARAVGDGASVSVRSDMKLDSGAAQLLDWRTGGRRPAKAAREGDVLRVEGLEEGFVMVVVPAGAGG